jgi:hypothetical protein
MASKAGNVGAVSRTSAIVGSRTHAHLLTEVRRSREIKGKAAADNDGSLPLSPVIVPIFVDR